ncbi:MAG: DUF4919 domain-containing protein, partial [Ignavibacteria bacterium]|nr:DUF4919 domain-containing protein [Ignavibacteria bacterium]
MPTDSTVNNFSNYHIIDSVKKLTANDFGQLFNTLLSTGTTDYLMLHLSYTRTEDYSALNYTSGYFDRVDSLAKIKKYKEALALADTFIFHTNPVSIRMHVSALKLAEILKDSIRVMLSSVMAENLTRAIFATGDGKSPERAFIVIDVGEEYWIMSILDINMETQSLVRKDGHEFDMIEYTDS